MKKQYGNQPSESLTFRKLDVLRRPLELSCTTHFILYFTGFWVEFFISSIFLLTHLFILIFNYRKRKPWMLFLTMKNLTAQNFPWIHDRVNHVALHVVETETLPNIFFNEKEVSKRSHSGSVCRSSIFFFFLLLQGQILPIYDIFRPSIHLSSTNLFVFCLFFLGGGGGGGGRFHILFVLCLLTCPSSPTQSHSPPRLPILMRWCRDKTTILSKHFPQSLKVCFIRCRYQYDSFITYSSIFGYLPLKVSSWIWVVSC